MEECFFYQSCSLKSSTLLEVMSECYVTRSCVLFTILNPTNCTTLLQKIERKL